MSTTLMTIEEGARHLGVSSRTIRSYIAQHLLSTRQSPGSSRKWLDPAEVEELRKDRVEQHSQAPGTRQREVLELRATVRRLRAEMDLVLRVLDVHEAPLRLDAASAHALHDAVKVDLQKTCWALDELTRWSEIFLRINEEDFDAIAKVTGARPWSLFLRLCVDMIVYVYGCADYKTSLDLQTMHRLLTEARRRLRIAALCYEDMYGAEMDRELKRAALIDSPTSVRESLAARARRKPA